MIMIDVYTISAIKVSHFLGVYQEVIQGSVIYSLDCSYSCSASLLRRGTSVYLNHFKLTLDI
jgi:hypothetical protein